MKKTTARYAMAAKIQHGFSLIELMVVLVILAFFSGMVVLSIGDNFVRQLRADAERFLTISTAIADEAIYSSTDIGLFLTATSYKVLAYDKVEREWQEYENSSYELYELDPQININWSIEGFSRTDSDEDDSIFADEEEVTAPDREEGDSEVPQILMLSSGEVTAFEVDFYGVDEGQREISFRVISDGFSRPTLEEIASE